VGISDGSIRPKEGSFCSKAATACCRLSTETLSKKANERLEKLGVKVGTGAKVEKVDDQGVIAGGKRILGATVLWTAGVAASPIVKMLGAKTD
jgi:NADH dehydrogenase FAD-containing subunit